MGRNSVAEKPASYAPDRCADALFPGVRQRVLGYLFGQPGRGFLAAELIRLVGSGSGAVQRELARLVAGGLVTVTRQGGRKLYQANPAAPLYDELCSIADKVLSPPPHRGVADGVKEDVLSIAGAVDVSRSGLVALAERHHIKRLSLFGSAARGELSPDSDIDVLVEFEKGRAPSLGGLSTLRDELGQLFGGRKVDVATPAILNNPYRRREVERDMEVLYAA